MEKSCEIVLISLKIIRPKLCIEFMVYNQFHDTHKSNPTNMLLRNVQVLPH